MAKSKPHEAKATSSVSTANVSTVTKPSVGPRGLDEFGGQSDLVQRVSAMVKACRGRSVVFPHALLIGGRRDRRSLWASRLKLKRGFNVAAVALANKNARIIWALLTRGDNYRLASGAGPGNIAA